MNYQNMYTLFKHIYTTYCGNPEYNVALLGLERTGKTQIYKAIKDVDSTYMVGVKQEYRATVGLNTTQIARDNLSLFLWDLGGKPGIRKIWESYYPSCHGIVFVFDERIDEGLQCLQTVITHNQMLEIPLLIFIRSSQVKSKIQQFLQRVNEANRNSARQTLIELVPHSRGKLWECLEWLYAKIRDVDKKVRN